MKCEKRQALSKESLCAFYQGDIYPLVITAIVLIGNLTALEVFFNTLHVLLAFGALCISRSIKPFIISLCTCYMQISVANSPFYPTRTDYYFSGWRFPVLLTGCVFIFIGLFVFVIRNRVYAKISLKKTPHIIPLLILSVAFLLNGSFSSSWKIGNLIFSLGHVAVYLLLFLLMYHGFSDEDDAESLSSYFAYISMLISLIISAELLHLFITSDTIFVDGSINKVGVALGWGIWNLVGVSLAVLIPVLFYGMNKNKYPWLYFASATVTYLASVLTMSRNALIFSTLIYACCVIISCFIGKNKRVFRIIVGAMILLAALMLVILWDKIYTVLADYFSRGFSDNGRFDMWRAAFKNFIAAPIFGKGFYGLVVETYTFGPLPIMAHNTVLELLSATGIIGLLAYLYYVFDASKRVFKRPTFMKTMLALSMLVLIAESMLDNFVFNIYPVFYYSVAMAIIVKSDDKKEQSSANLNI